MRINAWIAVGVLAPAAAWAQATGGLAWARFVGGAVPVAPLHHQLNPAGGAITARQDGLGTYTVTIPGMGASGGVAHAVAQGGSHYCNLLGWGRSGSAEIVSVRCYDPAGNPFDGGFNLLYYKETREAAEWIDGYLGLDRADPPLAFPHVPAANYLWNPRLGPAVVTRVATGTYLASFSVPLPARQTVLLTAQGGNARCRTGLPSGNQILVTCATPAGTLADSRFALSLITDSAAGMEEGQARRRGAFLLAGDPAVEAYVADGRFHHNSGGGPARIRRAAKGSYEVEVPGVTAAGPSTILVTRTQAGANGHCNVGWWRNVAAGTSISVRCFGMDGAAEDGAFLLTYLTHDAKPAPAISRADPQPARRPAWVAARAGKLSGVR